MKKRRLIEILETALSKIESGVDENGRIDMEHPASITLNGICAVLNVMAPELISEQECIEAMNYVRENRPKRGEHYDRSYKDEMWFWQRRMAEPRIKWLRYRIQLEKRNLKGIEKNRPKQ